MTFIRLTEKVFNMRGLLLILILVFSFQSLTKADDIRDFQIEGMSIGDSLLDFYSEDNIKNYLTTNYQDNTFSESELDVNSDQYNVVQVRFKTNDNKYIIVSIGGLKWYKDNIDACYKKQNKIYKEVFTIFKEGKKNNYKKKHAGDPSGKSTNVTKGLKFKNGDVVTIQCYDWAKKMKYWDHLRVSISTKVFEDWLRNKAYK